MEMVFDEGNLENWIDKETGNALARETREQSHLSTGQVCQKGHLQALWRAE